MLGGRQVFESSHSGDLRVAVKLLRQRKSQVGEGRLAINPSKTPLFSDTLKTYIAQVENPNTKKRYQLAAGVLLREIGDCRIDDLTPAIFDTVKARRIESGVTPAGVNRELALGRAALNLAVERRLIPFSPFSGVKLFNEAKYRLRPYILSFEEEAKLLACCDLRLRTLVILIVETGLRVGIEALSLRWEDVNFEEGTITVQHSKTVAGQRVIPMTAFCNTALHDWRSAGVGISEYVFFNPQDPTLHIRSVKTAWRNALRKAGLPQFAIYQGRHCYATRLAAAGVPDAIIDQLLGHARRDILSHYTARVPEYLRDAISRLEQLRRSKESAPTTTDAKLLARRQIVKGSNLIQ